LRPPEKKQMANAVEPRRCVYRERLETTGKAGGMTSARVTTKLNPGWSIVITT
jgi:hypothetical protein